MTEIYLFNDFYIYYIASRLYWSGNFIYGITSHFVNLKNGLELGFKWATGYSYPPFLAFALYPFQFLDPHTAALIWTIINLSLLLVIFRKIYLKFGPNNKTLLIYLLTFLPIWDSLLSGQVNIIFLGLIYLYFFSASKLLSGLALGLAAALKVYPILFIVLELMRRNWRKSIIALGVFVGLQIPFLPLSKYYFLEKLTQLNSAEAVYPHLQSLTAFLARFLTDYLGLNIVLSISIVLILLIYSSKHLQTDTLPYIWLVVLTALPSLNSFANFTPCILSGAFFISHLASFYPASKKVFIASAVISNLLFPLTTLTFPKYPFIYSSGLYSLILLLTALVLPRRKLCQNL